MTGESLDGLSTTVLPVTMAAERHARHDGQREVPGRDHHADTERDVEELVVFAGDLRDRLRFGEPQRLAAVELEKVDRLGDVGVRLGPALAHLVDHPRRELELALADDLGGAEQVRRPLLRRNLAPGFERAQRRVHRVFGVLLGPLRRAADHVVRIGGVDGSDAPLCLDLLAADDQRVVAAKLGADLVQRRLHLRGNGRIAEVGERLIDEWRGHESLLATEILECGGWVRRRVLRPLCGSNRFQSRI